MVEIFLYADYVPFFYLNCTVQRRSDVASVKSIQRVSETFSVVEGCYNFWHWFSSSSDVCHNVLIFL